ncbi:hypothetical protein CN544_21895 [Bacillus toyonensis]|uniref:hypothetical protein n=1 Tax=Bacillus toyonensis TaxID=155322 RepID=UPI000BF14389|nr:hypothetical protein [Bacillus toyonensis]PEN79277.1 hypothetical protein CN544_21895 [Bacillus toyonensis]
MDKIMYIPEGDSVINVSMEELEKLQEIGLCSPMFGEYLSGEKDSEDVDEEQQCYDYALDLKLKKLDYTQYTEAWEEFSLSKSKIAEYKINIGNCSAIQNMSNGYYFKNIKLVAQNKLERYLNKEDENLLYIPWYALYFIIVTRKENPDKTTAYGKDFTDNSDVQYDFNDEKCAYIGQTTSNRFKGGHSAFTKLNAPKYDGYEKRIYMASVSIKYEDSNIYIPLEFIPKKDFVDDIRDYIESALIFYIDNEFNKEWDERIKTENYKFVKSVNELHPTRNITFNFNSNLCNEHVKTQFFKNNFPTFNQYKNKLGY